ncbi:MAG: Cys-tRNA(Pro) deacylase [Lachnospiraceae bacterium]|nr:Cys-tRNA(Pro) deacylase [Lachnospiraceae bacterium]
MGNKNNKTNVMRVLDQKKIPYEAHFYEPDGTLTGVEIANMLGEDPNRVFKTLVTVSASKTNYVFVVPVEKELNLKKAAAAVGEKNIEMIKAKELLPLTGYIHGGCSPIGMKKVFKTIVDESVNNGSEIMFSGGKVGCQVHMKVEDMAKAFDYTSADIV